MLTAHHLYRSYGVQPILVDISFSIANNERVGLIGPNGCGKTTLMRILAGLESPDSGSVVATRAGVRIGYLAQGMDLAPQQTIGAALGIQTVPSAELELQVVSLAAALSADPDDPALQAGYDAVIRRLSGTGAQPQSVLAPLGLADFPLDTMVAHLSGGQKTRLMLARILLQEPHLLLLDEPTNHLDIAMLEWLEDWLAGFPGAALIISHDRAFLDHSVTSVLEIDPLTHRLRSYAGNYTDYVEQKLAERERQAQGFRDQQDQLAQLRAAAGHLRGLTRMKKGGKADGGDKFAKGFFGNRSTKNVAGRAKNIEARIEKILSEERIEKPRQSWQMKLDFASADHQSKNILITEDLSVGYPAKGPLLAGLNLEVRAGQRIALIGPNGSGKTTLIRTIAGRLDPLAGTCRLGGAVRFGYMAQEQELLDPSLSALESVQRVAPFNETEARHFLHFFLFSGDDPLRPTRDLSFGERARLQLGLLVAEGCNFLLLDEPINHLDIPSRARFEQALARFKGTVLAAVHDRYFIDQFASDIWSVEDGRIQRW
ncbi:MAG: ribosomal protection-like ABC-F family protein [Bacteroidota bacterium]